MIIVSPKNIENLKSKDLVKLECERCHGYFERHKKSVKSVLNGAKNTKLKYCSKLCQSESQKKRIEVGCKQCGINFLKLPSQIKKTKNNFCSKSCAAVWHNKNLDKGHGPKKNKFYYCKVCKIEVKYGNVYCKLHRDIYQGITVSSLNNKKCYKCNIIKDKSEFYNRTRLSSYCKDCSRKIFRDNDKKNRNKAKSLRKKIIDDLGGKCSVCGYAKNYSAINFHHESPADKSFRLDIRNIRGRKLSIVMEEVKKCILLCSNCHTEHHNPSFNKF